MVACPRTPFKIIKAPSVRRSYKNLKVKVEGGGALRGLSLQKGTRTARDGRSATKCVAC